MADVEEAPVEVEEEVEVEEDALVDDDLDEDDDAAFVKTGATEVKLFGKWSFDDIEVRDLSLEVSAIIFV